MSESTNTGTFLKKDSKIVGYMVYPRFLTGLALSETAKLIYVLLLDRARLSISNGGWADEEGKIYILYTLKSLAADSGRSKRTVSTALQDLETANLICLGKQEHGRGRRIYVKTIAESCNPGWQKPASQGSRSLRPNKNDKTKPIEKYICEEGESL